MLDFGEQRRGSGSAGHAGFFEGGPDEGEAVRFRVGQGTQQDRVDDAEDGAVDSDAES